MSKYNSTLKYVASTPRSQRKGKGARYYGSTIPSLPSAGGVSLSYVEANFVTLNTEQAISGIKDFTNGLKIGGLSAYKSQDDTIYFDCNIVARGGITAFGTNETITASIFEALPIDGATLKRTENGVLYVDTTVVGGGGGTGGGISIADVENYLTTNGYATQSWVTARGYITGITGTMVTNALGYTPLNKTGDVLTLKANQYSGAYALDMQNSNIVNLNAIFTSDVANDPTEGIQFKRTNGNFDSIWAADGIMYFSPNGNNAEMMGKYATSYAVLHAGNYGSYPVRNPNALSWSGYSSGSYDGSTAQNIALPTKLSQLTDDVVSGKYLSLAGGTVNGQIISKGYDNYIAQGDTYTLIFGIGSDQVNRGIFDSANNSWMLYRDATTNILIPTGNLAIGGTTATEKLHVYGNILATGGITAPTFTGVASNATYWNAPSSIRPTTANVPVVGNTTFSHYLATSSMTTGKPSNDGYIIHGEWDTVAGWSAQLFFSNGSPDPNNRMQWRAMDSGTWGEWKSLAFIDTGMLKPTQGLQINHIGSNYAEGIRLANRNGISNTWSEINFGCDPSATTGTHATQWTVGRNGNNNYFVIRNNATDRIQIDLSGNTTLTGNFVATGGVTAQNSSDRRLKRNISTFNASATLKSLGGVYMFDYIDSEVQRNGIYKGTHFGLIYQNVRGTALDAMCHVREDGMGALNYIHPSFISLIAGATIENISEVEKLKRKIRHLEAKVKQLENRV